MRSSGFTMVLALLVGLSGVSAMADEVKLKDGRNFTGTVKSASPEEVVIEVAGNALTFKMTEVARVTMGSPAAPAPNPKPEAKGARTLPAKTALLVRTVEPITSRTAKAGASFSAKLETDLVAEGQVIAPAGSKVYGVVAEAQAGGRVAKKAKLTLKLTQLTVDGVAISIAAFPKTTEGESSGAVRKAAKGAAVGALIDGSDGAKTGAAILGGAAILRGAENLNVPAGSLIEFTTSEPIEIPAKASR